MRIKSDDSEIFYEVMGSGPPVVLLHPFPANHEIWMPVAEQLASRWRVILPDLRGHGDSGTGNGPAIMQKHAADLAHVCDDANLGKAIFAGVSIGGYVLFEFWRQYRERVAALALVDTRAAADSDESRAVRLKAADAVEREGAEPFIDQQIPRLLGETTRRNRPDLVDRVRRMMAKMTVQGIAAVQRGMAARPDSTPTFPRIGVPTLVMCGDEDALTTPAEMSAMQRQIPGSSFYVIPQAGHYSVFERSEDATRILRQFLEAVRS